MNPYYITDPDFFKQSAEKSAGMQDTLVYYRP